VNVSTLAGLAVALAAAARGDAAPAYQDVLIQDVPHVRQKPDFCGEACAEMFLRKLGRSITQDQVFNESGLDPLLGRGCYTAELKTALQHLGFKTGDVWRKVPAGQATAQLEAQFKALHADLLAGVPSIACTHYSDAPDTTEHFRLILGYDAQADEVIYHEPAEADGAYRRMKREQFLKLWPLRSDERVWTVIRLRLEAGKIPSLAQPDGFTNADYAQHVMQLKKRLPAGQGFTVVLQPPFIVAGDEPAATVRRRAVDTVKFAVDRLKREYFEKDPAEIIDVWLFKDKDSYEQHTRELFNDQPTTPFGYYSSEHRALIMNIATGGGTLVHEIVHPFMRANFPECPPWLNEGLGSLYEQCGDRDGHIWGYTNWRLAGLQEAIRAGSVPSFETLTAMKDDEFYHQDRGTNYSQSRYLCYYLQEQKLLVKFYREFVTQQKDDPTGYATLKRVLGKDDMAAFKKEWEAFVLKLTFR